jgi:hypothetical protein
MLRLPMVGDLFVLLIRCARDLRAFFFGLLLFSRAVHGGLFLELPFRKRPGKQGKLGGHGSSHSDIE